MELQEQLQKVLNELDRLNAIAEKDNNSELSNLSNAYYLQLLKLKKS